MAKWSDAEIQDILNQDGLSAAERVTGKSYRDDKETQAIGILMHSQNLEARTLVLEGTDDTPFSCDLPQYERIARDIGFRQVFELPFFSDSSGEHEKLCVWWDAERGLLLKYDTFWGKVNGGKFFYNWRPHNTDEVPWHQWMGGGGYRDRVWIGDQDCREAIRFKIRKLAENGDFVVPWVGRPFLYFLHHMDTKREGYDYNAITAERVAALPEDVRKSLGPEPQR